MKEMNEKQTNQLLYEVVAGIIHETSHCIGSIEMVLKNEFISDIKIKTIGDNKSTIKDMLEYQKKKLTAIQEIFLSISRKMYNNPRENTEFVLSNQEIYEPVTKKFLGFLEVPICKILSGECSPVTERDILRHYQFKE